MTKTKNSTRTSLQHKKRIGHHKKHTDSYRKVYWPYIPMLVMLLIVLVFGNTGGSQLGRVLGARTSITELGLLTATNNARAQAGEQSVTLNKQLSAAAMEKAKDMSERDYWSHNTPDNVEPWTFIDQQDFAYSKAGENLAYGFLTSEATVAGWMQSESHKRNMLDATFTEVGFGIVTADSYQGGGEETIVVAFYATPAPTVQANAVTTASPPTQEVNFFATTGLVGLRWISFAIGTLTGLSAAYLIGRHSLRLKRIIKHGEHFIMHHPLLDLGLTGVIVVGVFFLNVVGYVG